MHNIAKGLHIIVRLRGGGPSSGDEQEDEDISIASNNSQSIMSVDDKEGSVSTDRSYHCILVRLIGKHAKDISFCC